jgi:hypothetical protein
MSKSDRIDLIRRLEAKRNTKVLTYLTSTRPNLEAQMAMDAVTRIYSHLRRLSLQGSDRGTPIDLFLVSNGGDGIVPWRLVTLIRECCKRFNVLIPYKACGYPDGAWRRLHRNAPHGYARPHGSNCCQRVQP